VVPTNVSRASGAALFADGRGEAATDFSESS
jgi:hypothetical protein